MKRSLERKKERNCLAANTVALLLCSGAEAISNSSNKKKSLLGSQASLARCGRVARGIDGDGEGRRGLSVTVRSRQRRARVQDSLPRPEAGA